MRKNLALGLCLCLILFSLFSCQQQTTTPKAGTASPADMLNLLPADSQGVLFADIHEAMSIETVIQSIEKQDNSKKYFEFIEKTGVDPKKDIYFMALSISAKDPDSIQKVAAVINMKYNKDALLEFIQTQSEQEEQVITETEYNGYTIHSMEEDGEQTGFAFLDESNIAAGNLEGVQSILDIVNKQGDNIYQNQELSNLLKQTNQDTLFWGAFLVPQETVEKAAAQSPMLQNLKSVSGITLNFDYKNNSILVDVNLQSSDPEKNEQLAKALNGLISFASMSQAEKPEIGELVNRIQVTSGDENVKISADFPEELIKKVTEMTQEDSTQDTEK
ncbi:MAG: DUF3352 domain-containing protein [Candidatus Aminicenantes bacterium]|nr:DUF3352 domain-containing protein [Candidatus Aminicenantes bacterium]